ncbi:MAG: autotransporter outer membrane beta-barrel domain-containing protein [Lactobacillaceae bacterium]|jgi:outer membrane autotransporter protein|nr:autotransporter outer membrane beta-barrel domain-containing protein [Lactobacillaceae bacterium]
MNNLSTKPSLLSFFLSFFLSCASANSATLTITGDVDLPSGGTYSGSVYGVSVSTANGSNPWKLTTGGDLNLSTSQFGIRAYSGSKLEISGTSNGKKLIMNSSSNSSGVTGLYVDSGVGLTIKNMDIEYISNTMPATSGSSANALLINGGSTVNLIGNTSGANTLKTNSNISNGNSVISLYTRAANSTINIENMSIEFKGNRAYDNLIAIGTSGGANNIINVTGVENGSNKLDITGNTSTAAGFRGIYNSAQYTNSEINIKYMDIDISGNAVAAAATNYGLQNVRTMNIIGSANRNILSIRNNTGGQVLGMFNSAGASAAFKNMDVYSKGNAYFAVVMNAAFDMDNTVINMEDANAVFANNSSISTINVKNGSKIYTLGGMLIYTFGGATTNINVDKSYISGHTTSASGSKNNIKLENSSEWAMKKTSVLGTLTNSGSLVDMRNSGSGAFNTLTVGDYVSANGNIIMNVELGDDASLTDKLVINGGGNVIGSTKIEAIVVGSNGNDPENNGIKIISAENGTTIADNVFSLKGDQVDNSAYIYKLFQGDVDGVDTQSWYLRSTGVFSDVAKVIANEPTAIVFIAKTGMNSLQKRLGELRENSGFDNDGIWVRSYGKDLSVKDKIKTDMVLYGTEAGYDHKFYYNGYKVYAGGMVGYVKSDDIENKQHNSARDGTGDGDAVSVGVYGTILTPSYWFVDMVVRNFWEDLDLTSYSASNLPIKYNLDRMITAYSIEVGKQLGYCFARNAIMTVEPKVELMYAHADAKNFTSNFGNHIRYGNTDAFSTKASLKLGYKKLYGDKVVEPFVQAGVIEEWAGTTNVIYDGAKYKSEMNGTSYEFGGGFNMQVSEAASIYSDVMYETGGNIKALSGNIGVRYTW